MAVAVALLPMAAVAQDYDKGVAAFLSGDFATALQEWQPLADQGDARAQSNLGWMYYIGEGVPQDYAEAMKWYRLAADQGDAGARTVLGVMYKDGLGVPQDIVTAHMWFSIAISTGNEIGRDSRDFIAKLMTPEQIAEAQRRASVCVNSNYKDCD